MTMRRAAEIKSAKHSMCFTKWVALITIKLKDGFLLKTIRGKSPLLVMFDFSLY